MWITCENVLYDMPWKLPHTIETSISSHVTNQLSSESLVSSSIARFAIMEMEWRNAEKLRWCSTNISTIKEKNDSA